MENNMTVAFNIFFAVLLFFGTAIVGSQHLFINNQTIKTLDGPHEENLNERHFLWTSPNSTAP